MDKTLNHCPHLGLKQNRAIRFASPTPEHRCYVSGEAQDIPVDQSQFCLSDNHVNCPLYMGLSMPSMSEPVGPTPAPVSQGGGGWLAILSPRDRLIYGALVLVLLAIIGVSVVMGMQSFGPASGDGTTPTPDMTRSGGGDTTATVTATDTPGNTPTPTPSPTSSGEPEDEPTATTNPEEESPTSSPTPEPTETVQVFPSVFVPTLAPVGIPPTATPPPPPTATPTTPPDTATSTPTDPTPATPTGPTSTPTSTPEPLDPVSSEENLTLYFADESGRLLVPVTRRATVESQQVATAALRELIKGPDSSGLRGVVAPDVQILEVRRTGDRLIVNLNQSPGDEQALHAIALTLTEFAGVAEVAVQVQGQSVGLPDGGGVITRPILNIDNPDNLDEDYTSGTRFLPLYFLSDTHYVRITRLVPRTPEVAAATVAELLAGPGPYRAWLTSPIPAGTSMYSVEKGSGKRVVVDLSQRFTEASQRGAALDTLVLSLTELRDSGGGRVFDEVEVLIEGQKLAAFWGAEYDRSFARPSFNVEQGAAQ